MRVGDAVILGTTSGGTPAQVTAVVGSGPSGYKVLDLVTAAGQTFAGVAHLRDNQTRYWCASMEEVVIRRKRRAPVHLEDE